MVVGVSSKSGTPAPAKPSPRDYDALTRQGKRSRAALLRAARRVFEKRGYHEARIADITAAARMAIGSFYTYFDSKEEIFQCLLVDVENEVYESPERANPEEKRPIERIRETNRVYLESFRRNAAFWAAIEEAALKNADARQVVTNRHRASRERTERAFRGWQDAGTIRPDLDVSFVASALGAMTERCAYLWFVYGEPVDLSTAADQITEMWAAALHLEPGS
jgi:AcrR family transcriptional regulator